jgi:hypothetical protein
MLIRLKGMLKAELTEAMRLPAYAEGPHTSVWG